MDTDMPTSGPVMAKSNSDLSVGGGDLIGVIVPKTPSCIDGTKVGRSTENCSTTKAKVSSLEFVTAEWTTSSCPGTKPKHVMNAPYLSTQRSDVPCHELFE